MSSLKKILVVDDDEGILEVMRIILEDRGYQIVVTTQALEVEKKIKQEQPDLILLDLWMAGLDGEEIIKKLKSQKKIKNIPTLVISALNDGEIRAKKAGADGFLAK